METAIFILVCISLCMAVFGFLVGRVFQNIYNGAKRAIILIVFVMFSLSVICLEFDILNKQWISALENNLGKPVSWQALEERGFAEVSVPIHFTAERQQRDKNLAVVQTADDVILLVQFDTMPSNRIVRVAFEKGQKILKDKGSRQTLKTLELRARITPEEEEYLTIEKSLKP